VNDRYQKIYAVLCAVSLLGLAGFAILAKVGSVAWAKRMCFLFVSAGGLAVALQLTIMYYYAIVNLHCKAGTKYFSWKGLNSLSSPPYKECSSLFLVLYSILPLIIFLSMSWMMWRADWSGLWR